MVDLNLIPICDKIFMVDTLTKGKFPLAFSILILGRDTRVLIDTGCGPDICKKVMETYEVDMIINSHCHPDHVAGNHIFKDTPLWVPEERAGETGVVKVLSKRLVGPDKTIMDLWENWVRTSLSMADYRHTDTFREGHIFDFGGVSLQAVHTPGHLEDHYCFLEPENNILFSFDVDLSTFGPFYGNPEADIDRLEATMDRIMEMEPACVASSHRLPVRENIMAELQAFKDKIARNQARVAGVMDVPRTLDEISSLKPIFGKYIPGLEVIYAFFEKYMIRKHLARMTDRDQVSLEGDVYTLSFPLV